MEIIGNRRKKKLYQNIYPEVKHLGIFVSRYVYIFFFSIIKPSFLFSLFLDIQDSYFQNWTKDFVCKPFYFVIFYQRKITDAYQSILKVSKSQKQFFLKLHCPKSELNFGKISALASKMGQIKKKIEALYHS